LVGGFNPSEKYERQWEGLSHILWKINMFETTNQKIVPKSETGRYRPILVVVTYINYSFDQQFGWFNPHVG